MHGYCFIPATVSSNTAMVDFPAGHLWPHRRADGIDNGKPLVCDAEIFLICDADVFPQLWRGPSVVTRGGVLRSRRGTLCHRWSPCVARVGPGDIDFAFLWFSQSGLAQLFCSFFPWLCFCAPFSVWCSVLPAQLCKSIKTDLPSSSALHLLSCAPCSFWLSVLAAQRPKSFKTDLPALPVLVCLAVLLAVSGGPPW